MEELMIKPGDLRNVRLADYLGKRSSAFPRGWNIRYVVLSGNFLFVYINPSVSPPHARARPSAPHVSPPAPPTPASALLSR
jgi:hypothetical protein